MTTTKKATAKKEIGNKKNNGKCYKIGRINMTVAHAAHIQAADIVAREETLKHIYDGHCRELESMGYTPLDFIKYIAKNYNQLWKEVNGRVIVVNHNYLHNKIMVIELCKTDKKDKGEWQVITAFYCKVEYLKNKKQIWQKPPLSSE